MNAALAALRREIEADGAIALRRLDEAVRRRLEGDGDRALVALALHHAYTAIESLLDRLVRHFDGGSPTGPDSHRALLTRAALDIPGIRPALLGAPTVERARELLRFRHFLHHDYGAELDGPQLEVLQAHAQELATLLAGDLAALDTWLQATAAAG